MFEPVSTRNLTSTPSTLLVMYMPSRTLLPRKVPDLELDAGAVDNDVGPNLGPLVRSAFVSLFGQLREKCPGSPQDHQFPSPVFLGPLELTCSIPGWKLQAGVLH